MRNPKAPQNSSNGVTVCISLIIFTFAFLLNTYCPTAVVKTAVISAGLALPQATVQTFSQAARSVKSEPKAQEKSDMEISDSTEITKKSQETAKKGDLAPQDILEMAKKYNVEVEVLSSLKRVPGTIVKEVAKMEKMLVRGVTKDTDVARISITNIPNIPGIAFKLFSKLAQARINVDIILQSVGRDGTKDISFTVSKENAEGAIEAIHKTFDIDDKDIICDKNVAKISIVGAGMETHPGTASKMFEALFEHDINIDMIATSEIKISVLIDAKDADRAVSAVHKAFLPEE